MASINYAITHVNFKKEKRHIEKVKIRKLEGNTLLSDEQIVDRENVISAIKQNVYFVTAYMKDRFWQKGDDVEIVVINNTEFIRTDGNKVEEDNLGELPEF